MLIANPIYDAAFKFLMQDLDVASQVLSSLMCRVVEVENFNQTELAVSNRNVITGFNAQRLDFHATITELDGTKRRVLIELQKARRKTDMVRFKRYLASAYAGELQDDEGNSLPIVTVYILGFTLQNITCALVKTNNKLINSRSNNVLDLTTDDNTFISQLTHESHFIQLPLLEEDLKQKLDAILNIFAQAHQDFKNCRLDVPSEACTQDNKKVMERLSLAFLEPEVARQLLAQQSYEKVCEEEAKQDKAEGKAEGIEEGIHKGKLDTARNLKKINLPVDMIMQATGLSETEIEAL
jgi:predicted transposase/invertase (TIGR01784 family)